MRTIDGDMATTSSPDTSFAEMTLEQVTANLNSVGFHQEGTPQRKLGKSEVYNRSPEWDIITFVHPKKDDKVKVRVRNGRCYHGASRSTHETGQRMAKFARYDRTHGSFRLLILRLGYLLCTQQTILTPTRYLSRQLTERILSRHVNSS